MKTGSLLTFLPKNCKILYKIKISPFTSVNGEPRILGKNIKQAILVFSQNKLAKVETMEM